MAEIGPLYRDWPRDTPDGNCRECGGQCAPECGRHPMGCIYGGFTTATSYWIISKDCDLYHGEKKEAAQA